MSMNRTLSAHRVERVDYLTLCNFSNQKKERLMVPGTKKSDGPFCIQAWVYSLLFDTRMVPNDGRESAMAGSLGQGLVTQ